ncbi:MAG: protein kinase [Myxococcota bacterium]
MTDRICERCHKILQIEADVCPEDGGRLLSVGSPESLIGRELDKKLTLTGVLGQGGMGVVYRARQHSMDREVAVKVLHPGFANDAEAVRRFLHEARAATRLDHPNVITVFDFGRSEDGLLYIVMEMLVGHNLGAEVDNARIAPTRAVHILTQVSDALHHAHERGLIHRDMKPENVFLVHGSALRGDFVKVLDFGIAMMRAQEGLDRITRTGSVCGTPAYMSPEQVMGDQIDARSDVYSLGVVAFEMLTGVHPMKGDTPMRQMLAHLEQPVPSFAAVGAGSVPPALEAAVRRAMEKKRELRTPTALAFANELVAALGSGAAPDGATTSQGVQPPTSSERNALADTGIAAAPPLERKPKQWRAALPYVAISAVIAIALIFLLGRESESGPREAQAAPDPVAITRPPQAEPATGPTVAVAPKVEAKAEPVQPKPEPKPEPAQPKPEPAVAPPVANPTPANPTPPEVSPTPAPVDTPAPAPVVVKVMLETTPSGAKVYRGTDLVGTTPLEVARPTGDAHDALVVKLAGHLPAKVDLSAASDTKLALRLKPAPASTGGHKPGDGTIE